MFFLGAKWEANEKDLSLFTSQVGRMKFRILQLNNPWQTRSREGNCTNQRARQLYVSKGCSIGLSVTAREGPLVVPLSFSDHR